jgi:hypothetical protein
MAQSTRGSDAAQGAVHTITVICKFRSVNRWPLLKYCNVNIRPAAAETKNLNQNGLGITIH